MKTTLQEKQQLDEFYEMLCHRFTKQDIYQISLNKKMLTITVLRSAVLDVMQFLRDDASCLFSQLTDITCVHTPLNQEEPFELIYHLLSVVFNKRICLKVLTQSDVRLNSVFSLFPNALWYEREIREMFGLCFENHPDLRRLITDDEQEIFPLLKTYPLEGCFSIEYDKERQRCVFVRNKPKIKEVFYGEDLAQGRRL